MKLKALVTSEITDHFVDELNSLGIEVRLEGWGQTRQVLTEQDLIRVASDCQIIICELESINSRVLAACPDVRFIGACRGNPVNVDLGEVSRRAIWLATTPGRNADSVADYTVAALIVILRQMNIGEAHLRTRGWMVDGELPYFHFRGQELGKTTMGLYGAGAIGRKVARRLIDGFGTKVLYFDPYVPFIEGAHAVGSLDELCERVKAISLHVPVTPETRNSINAQRLRLLGSDGILINTARADLIVESELYSALNNGEIRGAALDVFWDEPLPPDSHWFDQKNVLITPHIAGASKDVIEHHCDTILSSLRDWLATQEHQNHQRIGGKHES